jgi:hypothetical protein
MLNIFKKNKINLTWKLKAKDISTGKTFPVASIDFENKNVRLRVRKSDGCDNGLEYRKFEQVELL